jgi:hypothetical protein
MGTTFDINPFLQPNDAPVVQPNTSDHSAFDFSTNITRNSVTSTKIKNFSFGQGTGGTLTLGGANNQSGELIMKDSNNNTLLVFSSAGINGTQSGSITNSGTSIFNGIISQRQLILIQAAGASGGAQTSFFTDSSTPQGIDASRFSLNPNNYPSNTMYLELVYRAGTNGEAARTLFVDLYDITGGTPIQGGTFVGTTQSGAGYGVYPRERSVTNFLPFMVAGTRDYMIRYWATSSSGTLFVDLYEARLVIDFT